MDPRAGKPQRREWTDDEDLRLRNLVQTYGVKRWAQIANELGGRIGKQCRERWTNHLADDISKEPWTEEEDAMLQDAMARFSKKWATIAKLLPGRTENAVKNRYNASIRRNERSQRKNGVVEEGSHPKAESALPACRQGHAGDTPAQLNVLGLVANSGSSDATGTPASSSLGYNTPTLNTAAEELSAHHRLSNSHLAQSGSGLPELVSPGAAAAALPAGEPSASRKRPRSLSTAAASVPRARPRARQGAAPPVLPSMLPAEPHAEEEALLALAQQSERAASLSASTVKEAVRGLRRALKIGDGAADGATESGTNGQETSMPASGHVEMRAHDGAFASCPLLSLATAATTPHAQRFGL